jgi:hypothetical protein
MALFDCFIPLLFYLQRENSVEQNCDMIITVLTSMMFFEIHRSYSDGSGSATTNKEHEKSGRNKA